MPNIEFADLRIHYVEEGEGQTLLIFPDNIQTASAYAAEIAYFADRFHVLAFDYPGTGLSTHEIKYLDEQEYDLWNFRADLACHLLMDLGVERVYAMGSGGGALAALHFAGKQARLHRLTVQGVVADSFLADRDPRSMHRALDVREHYYVRNEKRLLERHGEDWRAIVDWDTNFQRRLADHGGYAVPNFVLNAIPCPVLLTGNMSDPLTPGIVDDYARLATRIPDCTVHVAARSFHPYIEYPWMWSDADLFRDVVDLFVSRPDSDGA
jgi:pimeloyl-ACP methyl ester carboxylesterase